MKKHFFIPALLTLIGIGNLFSQQTQNPIPASPNVAELGKYGSWPVDYYHGLPEINIPIYDLKVGQLSLPISLSYHASGIKVDEEATWVGLGWSLNAGGIITCEIRGGSDFKGNYTSKTFEQIDNGDFPTYRDVEHLEGSKDGEPDIYSYNFAGYKGQFILDKTNNYKIVPLGNSDGLKFGNLTITNDDDPSTSWDDELFIASFTITDKFGIQYVFSEREITDGKSYNYRYVYEGSNSANFLQYMSFNSLPNSPYVSGWFLTKIVAPNGIDQITLHYQDETIATLPTPSSSIYYDYGIISHSSWENGNWYMNSDMFFNDPTTIQDYAKVTFYSGYNITKKLDYIEGSNNIKIDFSANFVRDDQFLYSDLLNAEPLLDKSNALSTIEISYNSKLLRSINFNYSYFNSAITTDQIWNQRYYKHLFYKDNIWQLKSENITGLNYRLKLTKLEIKDKSGTTILPYTFSYYGDDSSEPQMPFRTSFAGKDGYGYFNRNVTVDEACSFKNVFPNIHENITQGLSNFISYYGSLNPECGDENSLFPTTFGSFALGNFFDYPFKPYAFTFSEGWDITPDLAFCRTYTLKEITYPTGGKTQFEYELNHLNQIPGEGINIVSDEKASGLRIKRIINIGNGVTLTQKEYSYYSDGRTARAKIWSKPFPVVQYYLSDGSFFSAAELHSSPTQNPGPIWYSSVKEIDASGSIQYNYHNPYDDPIDYESRYMGVFNVVEGSPCQYTFSPWKLNGPIFPYQNDVVGEGFYWGKLASKYYFNTNGDPVKEEIYDYDFIAGDPIYATKISRPYRILEGGYQYSTKDYGINIYKINTGKGFLKEKKVVDYFGTEETTTTYHYTYDHEYDLLKEESYTNSKGETLKTTYIYPTDYSFPTGAMSNYAVEAIYAMKSKNIISTPLEVTNYNNEKVISSSLTTYKCDATTGTPNQYIMYNIESTLPLSYAAPGSEITNTFTPSYAKSTSPYFIMDNFYKPTTQFDKYDTQGNLLQYQKVNDINTSYFWGYSNTYPIAKIENAAISQCAYLGFEEVGTTLPYTSNGWNILANGSSSTTAKTGDKGFICGYTTITSTTALPVGKYRISFYAQKAGGTSNFKLEYSGSTPPTIPVNSTNMALNDFELTFTTSTTLKITFTGVNIDDLRLCPSDAQMTTYTYDPSEGMTSQTDPNGVTTYYEYDNFGRLEYIRDQDGKVLKQYDYNYAH